MSPTLGVRPPILCCALSPPEVGSDRTPFRYRGSRPLAGRHGYRYPPGTTPVGAGSGPRLARLPPNRREQARMGVRGWWRC